MRALPAWLALAGAAAYIAVITVAGLATPGYRACCQLISELGQEGAPHAGLMAAMLVSVGVIVLLLAGSLGKSLASRLTGALVATIGAGLVLGGIFRCDPGCAPRTFHGWAHILTSIPATLSALAGPFVAARAMKRSEPWRPYARASLALGWLSVVAIVAAAALFPRLGLGGAGQRLATLIQLGWMSFLAVALINVAARALREDARWPPGPSGLQALRYLGWRRRLLDFVERCRRDYGGICGIRVLGLRACLISDPALIEQVFVQHHSRIKKWDVGQFELVLGKGLLTSGGELWRRQRSLIQPAFAAARLGAYTEVITRRAEAMLDGWPKGGTVEIHSEMLRVSLKIAAEALFGADSSAVEQLIEDTQHQLMTQFEKQLSGIPIPLGVPTPGNLRTRRAIRRLDAAVMGLIARRRLRRHGREPGRDFLGALLAAQDEAGKGMSDQQLRDECMTMILAAHETTAVVLSFTLWLLARHPEATKSPELLNAQDLQGFLHESMRVYAPVWAIGRVAVEPLELGPHRVPAGTQLFLVPYLTHRDPATFAAPLEFRPERWNSDETRALGKGAYLPFGAGPRKCVGMHFAMHELTLILGAVVRRFALAPEPGHEVELQPSVTLRPRGGIKLRVKERAA